MHPLLAKAEAGDERHAVSDREPYKAGSLAEDERGDFGGAIC